MYIYIHMYTYILYKGIRHTVYFVIFHYFSRLFVVIFSLNLPAALHQIQWGESRAGFASVAVPKCLKYIHQNGHSYTIRGQNPASVVGFDEKSPHLSEHHTSELHSKDTFGSFPSFWRGETDVYTYM